MHMPFINGLKESCDREGCLSFSELTSLSKEKRLMVNDELVSIFLQGIRLSLWVDGVQYSIAPMEVPLIWNSFLFSYFSCSSFHYVALQSLTALKLRSQYEVFPLSIQVHTSNQLEYTDNCVLYLAKFSIRATDCRNESTEIAFRSRKSQDLFV